MAAQQAAQQAAVAAKKGFGMMLSASKVAVGAIAAGVQKARKGYANKHETDVLNDLRAKGIMPVEHIVEALKRLYYLMLAGYKHEIQACATLSAKRLTDLEKSSVPINVVLMLGVTIYEESLKYGDFQKNIVVQGMQDFLNKSRMGKDHYDRDSIAHDIYYAVLICAEEYETDWDQLQNCFGEAVSRTIEWAVSSDPSPDARSKAAKSVFYLGQAVKSQAQDCEDKRQKNIKDAERTLKNEQQRRRLSNPNSLERAGPPSSQYNQLPVGPAYSSHVNLYSTTVLPVQNCPTPVRPPGV